MQFNGNQLFACQEEGYSIVSCDLLSTIASFCVTAKRSRYRTGGPGPRGFDKSSSFGPPSSHKFVGGHDLRAGQKRPYSESQGGPPNKQSYGGGRQAPPPPPPSRPPQKNIQQTSFNAYNQSNGSWGSQPAQHQPYGAWDQRDKQPYQQQNGPYSYGY